MFKSIVSFILLLLILSYETANATESVLLTIQTAEDLSNQDGTDVTQDCGRKKDKSWLGTNLDIAHSYLGLRFHGPSLPPFSQITSAQLYVTNNFSANQKGSLDLEIRAEESINPEGFWCDIITAPSERLTTESYSNYHNSNNWLKNERLELDVSAPIQELAAENALGSSIALIIKGIGKKHERKFIDNLQKKKVALETLPYLVIHYDIIPPPSNSEALQTLLESLAGFEQFEISAEGIISVIINGQTINLNYDEEKGRLDHVTLPSGTQTIAYDDKGRIANITAIDGNTLSYSYDGSLATSETWTGTVNGSLQLTYDNDFQVSSASVNGNLINYQYDNDGLLTKAGDILLSRDMQNGLLTGTTLGNLTTQRNRNNFGELQEEIASFDNISLYQTHYERDKIGRIIQKTESIAGISNTFEYSYDLAGRLVEVKQNGIITESYQYDENGNRLNNNAIYDDQDRLFSYGSNHYTYTANGELLTKNGITYHYDVLGNLRQVQLTDKTIDYVIDARNRRIGKKVDGQLVQGFLYQGSLKPIAELDGNGQIVARFIYGSKANVPDYILKEWKTYRIISDHLGSPRLVVNIADGSVVQQMEFDAFGNVLLDTNPGFQPFGFAGGLYDLDTKLVRFGARDYDAEVGRWTAKDPIGFDGGDTNLYGYVVGNPVNWFDTNGLTKFDKLHGLPKKFWNWLHRHPDDINTMKGPNGQIPKDIAKSYYEEWLDLGKPKPDSKGKHRSEEGFIDPELLLDFAGPWGLLFVPSEIGCSELDCDDNGIPDHTEVQGEGQQCQ